MHDLSSSRRRSLVVERCYKIGSFKSLGVCIHRQTSRTPSGQAKFLWMFWGAYHAADDENRKITVARVVVVVVVVVLYEGLFVSAT